MRAGDNTVDVELTLLRNDGSLQPLVGTETVAFTFVNWLGITALTKSGSISNAPSSKVKCQLVAADTTGLRYQVLKGKALITFVSGATASFPIIPDDLVLALY